MMLKTLAFSAVALATAAGGWLWATHGQAAWLAQALALCA